MWLSIRFFRDLSIGSIDWLLWINFDCVFYFCAKCSIFLKEMNFSAEWIHNCSRWIIYYQPTELRNSFLSEFQARGVGQFGTEFQARGVGQFGTVSKLLRGAHPREFNFCLTIEFGLTINDYG